MSDQQNQPIPADLAPLAHALDALAANDANAVPTGLADRVATASVIALRRQSNAPIRAVRWLPARARRFAAAAGLLLVGALAIAVLNHPAPPTNTAPIAAVTEDDLYETAVAAVDGALASTGWPTNDRETLLEDIWSFDPSPLTDWRDTADMLDDSM